MNQIAICLSLYSPFSQEVGGFRKWLLSGALELSPEWQVYLRACGIELGTYRVPGNHSFGIAARIVF